MAKWKTKDVAKFKHDPNPKTTIIGKIECLLCKWSLEPASPHIFPTVDDAVERHMKEKHGDHLNTAGVQRVPAGGELVYYIITNP